MILHSEKCEEATLKAHPYLQTPGITFHDQVMYWMSIPLEESIQNCNGCYIASGMRFK